MLQCTFYELRIRNKDLNKKYTHQKKTTYIEFLIKKILKQKGFLNNNRVSHINKFSSQNLYKSLLYSLC